MKRPFAFTFVLISIGSSQDTSFYCDPWAQEPYGDYLIENNVWGQGTINEFSQCIFTTNDSSFGWTWDWPDVGYNVKAYPEIIFGKKPWSANSTTNELPLKIGNVESFKVNFDLNIEASGNYNLAFEFWVTEDSISNQDQITNEVMIWTANSLLQPAGEQISVFFSDGYYYDLFRAEFNDWKYYAFVSQTDQQEGTLNVHNFINYMVATGYLNPNEYMASFGYDRVPEQRSRKLPGQATGEIPIYQRFPRYGADWRDSLQERAPSPNFQVSGGAQMQMSAVWAGGEPPAWALKLWLGLFAAGGFELVRFVLTVATEMLKTAQG